MIAELSEITDLIGRFPGIGRKTAQRIAFFILSQPQSYAQSLANSITNFSDSITYCEHCFAIKSKVQPCKFCDDMKRDQTLLCVVEQPSDVYAIEATGEYRGLYHVLMGVLSPLDGISPEDLRIKEINLRINNSLNEIIIATNPSIEGNATANYINQMITSKETDKSLKISRIATGMALGSQLDFTDSQIISLSLRSRRILNENSNYNPDV